MVRLRWINFNGPFDTEAYDRPFDTKAYDRPFDTEAHDRPFDIEAHDRPFDTEAHDRQNSLNLKSEIQNLKLHPTCRGTKTGLKSLYENKQFFTFL
ncbi:hypothetical protein JY97_04415 [Alkalispirochaeta odontotermitis]|nr:hypothetical protein JY97_04415 [Alkalispirochaeta odontotermitis]